MLLETNESFAYLLSQSQDKLLTTTLSDLSIKYNLNNIVIIKSKFLHDEGEFIT